MALTNSQVEKLFKQGRMEFSSKEMLSNETKIEVLLNHVPWFSIYREVQMKNLHCPLHSLLELVQGQFHLFSRRILKNDDTRNPSQNAPIPCARKPLLWHFVGHQKYLSSEMLLQAQFSYCDLLSNSAPRNTPAAWFYSSIKICLCTNFSPNFFSWFLYFILLFSVISKES